MRKLIEIIPEAKKYVEIPHEQSAQNSIDGIYDVSKENFKEVAENSVVLQGNSKMKLRQYLNEYPILIYKRGELDTLGDDVDFILNSFVYCVQLSILNAGREYDITSPDLLDSNDIEEEILLSFETPDRDRFSLVGNDSLKNFFYQRPEIVVSPEGVLIFYTEKEIEITLDMEHFESLTWGDEASIQSIEVQKKGCIITLLYEGVIKKIQLKFKFDFNYVNPVFIKQEVVG